MHHYFCAHGVRGLSFKAGLVCFWYVQLIFGMRLTGKAQTEVHPAGSFQ